MEGKRAGEEEERGEGMEVVRDYNKDPVSITYGPSQYQLPTIM